MSIQERQNQPESLSKLAAQRLLYSRAKRMRNIDIVLILVVVILGLAASVVENQEFSYFVLFAALITWFLDQQILKRKESAFKKRRLQFRKTSTALFLICRGLDKKVSSILRLTESNNLLSRPKASLKFQRDYAIGTHQTQFPTIQLSPRFIVSE